MTRTLWLLLAVAACKPDLGDPPSLITTPRILAVQSDPAELSPSQAVTYHALVATPTGSAAPAISWSFCTEPAPLSSNNVVNDSCVTGGAEIDAGGTAIPATIPQSACMVFGPVTPAPAPGQPPVRPHDADVTGGFYQPIRALAALGGAELPAAIGLTRITCDLANAPLDIVKDFHARYRANQNPVLARVSAVIADSAVALPAALPAHTEVGLRAEWTADSAEPFPVFDAASRMLVDHRETIRVSWFASAGELASERTGRDETETETFADNVWTTPDAGPVYLWVVVRDSRGGVAFADYVIPIAE